MILYNLFIRYESLAEEKNGKCTLNPLEDVRAFRRMIIDMNDLLGVACGLDGNMSALIVGGQVGNLEMILACKQENVSVIECENWIKDFFYQNYSVSKVWLEKRKEISATEFIKKDKRSDNSGFHHGRWLYNELCFNYFDNRNFRIQEYLYDSTPLSKAEALNRAGEIMADDSFLEELERIYSEKNEKKYYGHPVHYKISAGNSKCAKEMIKLLIQALKSNVRILGTRVNYVHKIDERCYREYDLKNLFRRSKGVTVAMEMSGTNGDHGIYASSYHEVIREFERLVAKYRLNTLCIFVEITNKMGFAGPMIAAVQEDVHLIEIKEGRGDREKALKYLKALAENTEFKITEKEMEKVLPKQRDYSASEVHEVFHRWFSDGLKSKVYQAYRNCEKVLVSSEKKSNDRPYEELQKMIGLTEIKELVDQIINTTKIQKMRSQMGMDKYNTTKHMVFTGNPGSAKTTVARLLAEILKKEEVLESGTFVECGRADLIARYVGWTAKTVREKFKEAEGGILFIDEAYSLVDSSNSFGDEAINTIVQEMENYRERVIVIFAGYPEKMESFLEKNEGLRSRIAFHLNFPDYNVEEMVDILKLMVKEKGMVIDEESEKKCKMIFQEACKNEEFGNGRFVRNLLEQAILKQSDRIIGESKGKKVGKRALSTLKAEDFEVNLAKIYAKKSRAIGFCR